MRTSHKPRYDDAAPGVARGHGPRRRRGPAIDSRRLLELVGNDWQLAVMLIEGFRRQTNKVLDEIRHGLLLGDLTMTARAAHTLKGSLLSVGASAVAKTAEHLECLVQEGPCPAAGATVEHLETQLRGLEPELEALLEELSGEPRRDRLSWRPRSR